GAQFQIFFPAVQARRTEIPVLPVASASSGTETILLAEDEEGVRRYAQETLERRGYRVLACSHGPEAIERARQHSGSIHLLITDAVMPEMGGAELAALFADCRPGVPVLCMSGYSAMVWPGADTQASYLQKPFTPTVLLTRVRSLLDRGEVARPV
ncbi:MAG: response regulator, partial [Candidatus Solibacter sp.]|nr:response regulator [Candidatus Solibacter sp.]